MHRCSESIGAIAAALAKAQNELTNPEKSLTATIRSSSRRDEDRTFRYAPLSSGLDIVRKCLGRHEIATMQTTAIDNETGLIRLTTVLAHSSGEWVSSDWPVCPVSETAAPHRMGAALTYARRYALFTLVGIAGDDDMDAPDPAELGEKGTNAINHAGARQGDGLGTAQASTPWRQASTPSRRETGSAARQRSTILNSVKSATLRDQLLSELADIGSADKRGAWARRTLPLKNAMTSEDARVIEEAFRSRLAASTDPLSIDQIKAAGTGVRTSHPLEMKIPAEPRAPVVSTPGLSRASGKTELRNKRQIRTQRSATAGRSDSENLSGMTDGKAPSPDRDAASRSAIDKSVLALSEPRRYRNRAHLEFVASQPCLICERCPSDAHHIRFAQPSTLGRRVSDEFTVPLCRAHHRALHRRGNEAEWWHENRIDPIGIAQGLWTQSRLGSPPAGAGRSDEVNHNPKECGFQSHRHRCCEPTEGQRLAMI